MNYEGFEVVDNYEIDLGGQIKEEEIMEFLTDLRMDPAFTRWVLAGSTAGEMRQIELKRKRKDSTNGIDVEFTCRSLPTR